jgi:hypothetical protein
VLLTLLVAFPLYGPLVLPIPRMQRDAYWLGWHPQSLLQLLAIGAGIAAMTSRWRPRWMLVLSIALGGYAVDLLESTNLWDYLVDPLLLLVFGWLAAFPRSFCNPSRTRIVRRVEQPHTE